MKINTALFGILCLLCTACKKENNDAPVQPPKANITAEPATYFDSLFTRFKAGEWTGGDVASSQLLPDGRSLWLFGDSFTDTVYPDRHRPYDYFIHNSIVLTDSKNFTTLYNGTAANPQPFFEAEVPSLYWPNCAFISKDKTEIYVMLVVIQSTGNGGLF
ncbi:MAG TPA: hypothetical protein VGI61_10685, partial [Parafilimonas sp.]